jgi:hypothetical protein
MSIASYISSLSHAWEHIAELRQQQKSKMEAEINRLKARIELLERGASDQVSDSESDEDVERNSDSEYHPDESEDESSDSDSEYVLSSVRMKRKRTATSLMKRRRDRSVSSTAATVGSPSTRQQPASTAGLLSSTTCAVPTMLSEPM